MELQNGEATFMIRCAGSVIVFEMRFVLSKRLLSFRGKMQQQSAMRQLGLRFFC